MTFFRKDAGFTTPQDWRKLAKRVLTSAVLVSLIVYTLFFTDELYFSLAVTLYVLLGLYEFLTLLKRQGIPVYRVFGLGMGFVIPMVVYTELGATQSGEVLFLIFGCVFLFLLQFFRRNHAQALVAIALTLFGLLYISWFMSYLIKIRFMHGGVMWVAYLLCVVKGSDIGAYVVGSLFGHHKLMPLVSPKKSIEGALGGLAASVAVSLMLGPYTPIQFSALHLVLLGAALGILGQIGDLSESLMKRFCGAKDSGDLLPGMGGILDVVDSILFTAPIYYFHLKIYV